MKQSTIDLLAGNKITYKVKNARMVEMYTNTNDVEIIVEKDEIKGIRIEDKLFKVGDIFQHDLENIPSGYKIRKIMTGADGSKYKHRFTLFSHIRNKSTSYLLPLLGKTNNYFFTDSYLVNAYVSKSLDKLFLLYRYSKSDVYSTVEDNIFNHPNFVKIHNNIAGFDVFEFDIPKRFYTDVNLYINGKYSKISNEAKGLIRNFYNLSDKSRIWHVLTRDDSLKKELEKRFGCSFDGVDFDEKPNKNEEIWEHCVV